MATHEATTEPGHLLVTISNTIVGLYKRHYGKGPTKARTYYLDNLVVCTLRGRMTRIEETLARSGRDDVVAHQRQELHAAVYDEFVAAIEQLTGRRVLAFMSGASTEPDISVDIFMLEPEPDSQGGWTPAPALNGAAASPARSPSA
jgi:uncharacterized protein YbcI